MKVLLSNAPWYKIDTKSKTGLLGCRAGSRWPHMRDYKGKMISRYQPFPFFLATASSMLKNAGFEVILRDSIVIGETYEEYYRFVEEVKPDFIMLEVSTPSMPNDLQIIRHIKEILPQTIIVAAGLHASLADRSFLEENEAIDFTIYGEYEHPLLKLVQALVEKGNLDEVPNLVYRSGNGIKKTEREPLVPIAELPWPDREALPDTYYDGCGGMFGRELQIHTSRGCPFRCNFCVLPQVIYAGPSYRMREPQDVIDEILYNFEKISYTHFYIDDDTININKEHFMELCRLIKANGLNQYPWACMGRGDLMDDEMLHAMKDAGCYAIKYGVESFDESVLAQSGKALDLKKNIENIKKTQELGIKVHLTYCLGMLGDTRATVEDTIRKSLELRADSRQYSIATPFAGSRLWEIYKEKGLLLTDDLSRFDANHEAVVDLEDLPAEELVQLKREAERQNKQQIIRMVPSQFRTAEFAERFRLETQGLAKILVTGTARRSVVRKMAEMAAESAERVDILTHEEYLEEYDGFPSEHLITFEMPEHFCKSEMVELIERLKSASYDAVIIPSRTFTMEGMENVAEVAREISQRVIMVYGHGEMKNV